MRALINIARNVSARRLYVPIGSFTTTRPALCHIGTPATPHSTTGMRPAETDGQCPLASDAADDAHPNEVPPPPAEGVPARPPPPTMKITVQDAKGQPVSVQPVKLFSDVADDLPTWLNKGIRALNYGATMPVQGVAIPLLLERRDIVGIAPTGSGKTVAFAVPALANVDLNVPPKVNGMASPQILVLCPTRELVQQSVKVFSMLGGGMVVSAAAFGGSDREAQGETLRRGAHCLVAAPGRLIDYVESNVVSLDKVSFLVMDEADRMLEMGFAPQLNAIMNAMPKTARTTMMWSATWSDTVASLAREFMSTDFISLRVEGDGSRMNKDIEQNFYLVPTDDERFQFMCELYHRGVLKKENKTIIFLRSKDAIDDFVTRMSFALGAGEGIIQGLHGGMRQNRRDMIVRRFSQGHIRVLIASDVAARGLDIPHVDDVVNFDLPNDEDGYVHRIGRTGRAGRKGRSHTLVARNSRATVLPALVKLMKDGGVELPKEITSIASRIEDEVNEKQHRRYARHRNVTSSWRDASSGNVQMRRPPPPPPPGRRATNTRPSGW